MDENNNFENEQTNNNQTSGRNAASYGAFNQGSADPSNQYGQYDGSTDPSNQYNQYNQGYDQQYGQYNQGYDGQYGQYNQGYDGQQYGQYDQSYNQQQYGQYNQGYNQQQYGQYPQPQQKKSRLPMIIIIIVCALALAAGAGFAGYKMFIEDSEETTAADSESKSNTVSADKDDEDEKATEMVKEKKTPEPTEPPAPVFTGYEASSTRGVDHAAAGDMYYYPSYAVDGDMTTAWSSNRSIELTPTYTLRAETKQHVTGIRMTNGYCKSMDTYTRNRRITQVTVSYEGGSKTQSLSTDAYREMQEIRFDEPVDTSYIQIHVDDSIYGDWLDIAISEIEVF